MKNEIYVGKNNTAKKIKEIFTGINGTAKRIVQGYVGINNIAKQIYQYRTYLLSNHDGTNPIVGNWTSGNYVHLHDSGTNYESRTRMTYNNNPGNYSISGFYNSDNSKNECSLFTRSAYTINLTDYNFLKANISVNIHRENSADQTYQGIFGAYDISKGETCKTGELETKFVAFTRHGRTTVGSWVDLDLSVNISNLQGSYAIVYDNFHLNTNAKVEVKIFNIWLE